MIEQPAPVAEPRKQEPVAWRELCRRLYVELFHCDQQMMATLDEEGDPMWQQGATVRDVLADARDALEASPPAQRKPLHIGEETAAFKAWFDAWWIGDGEQDETIPAQSDKDFLTYLDHYTLGFGAWMAAKHAAHGIKENK